MNPQALTALSVVVGPDDERSGEPPLSVESAVAILAALDTPYRLTWFGLLGLLRRPGRVELGTQSSLEVSLVRSLLDRRSDDPPIELDPGAEERFLEISRAVADREAPGPDDEHPTGLGAGVVEALSALIGIDRAETLSDPRCETWLEQRKGRRVLVVRGDDTFRGVLDRVGSSIQPINWPQCNEQFRRMSVVDGSFAHEPLKRVGTVVEHSFRCAYVETVELYGLQPTRWWAKKKVVTCLGARHWHKVDANGHVVEIGMEYWLVEGGDGQVVVDQGHAVVTDVGNGFVRMRSEKVIAFRHDRVLDWFELPFVDEAICVMWNHQFDITIEEC
jgi:hypothetical protein